MYKIVTPIKREAKNLHQRTARKHGAADLSPVIDSKILDWFYMTKAIKIATNQKAYDV